MTTILKSVFKQPCCPKGLTQHLNQANKTLIPPDYRYILNTFFRSCIDSTGTYFRGSEQFLTPSNFQIEFVTFKLSSFQSYESLL